MPKSKTEANARRVIREAATWPNIRDIAEQYGLPERFVRGAVERRKVTAVRLDMIRINPDSWVDFMRESYREGEY